MLLEVLIAIGLIAMIALIVVVALQAGPRTTETASKQSRGFELAAEAQEIVRDIANRNWLDVCDVAYEGCQVTSSIAYYPTSTTGEWTLLPGSETKTLSNTDYTRSIVIDNVCRDESGAIVAGGGGGGGGGGGCTSPGCTLNNFSGFETGGLEEAAGVFGSPEVQSTVKRTGSYALKVPANGLNVYRADLDRDNAPSAGTDHIVGFALNVSVTTPTVFIDLMTGEFFPGADENIRLRLQTDGNIKIVDGNNAEVATSTSPPLTPGAWHFVELYWQSVDTGGAAELFIDGVSKISVTGQDFMKFSSEPDAYKFENLASTAVGEDFYIDDYYAYTGAAGTLSTSDFLGDHRVLADQTDCTGTQSALCGGSPVGAELDGGVWENTDEDASGAGYDGLVARYDVIGGKWGSVDVPDFAAIGSSDRINAVKVGGRLRSPSGGSGAQHFIALVYGGVTGDFKEIGNPISTSFEYYELMREKNELGTDWTVEQANQAEVGFGKGSGGRDIEADALWVMVSYTPSSPSVSCEDDPSTRKVTTTVSAKGISPIELITYLTRWGQKAAGQTYAQNCVSFQTDWSGGTSTASVTGTVPCISAGNFGSFFSEAWYQELTSTSVVTGIQGIEYQQVPGSLFMEPQL